MSRTRLFSAAVILDIVTPERESWRLALRFDFFLSSPASLGLLWVSVSSSSGMAGLSSNADVSSVTFFRNMGLICTLVPASPLFFWRIDRRALSFAGSSTPCASAFRTACFTLANAGSPMRRTSSWWPFSSAMNGSVWNVNLYFCFGVRSAWRMTDTMPLSFHECFGGGGAWCSSGPTSGSAGIEVTADLIDGAAEREPVPPES